MDTQLLLLCGRATDDSELLTSKNKKDKNFAVFSVATNRYLGKDNDAEVTYYDCICFNSSVEKLVEKIKKGDRVVGKRETTGRGIHQQR